MLDILCNKMTKGMLWAVIGPTFILILTFSWLIGAYAFVVGRSDYVFYDGFLGKFSAKITAQLDDALRTNEQLIKVVAQLKKTSDGQQKDMLDTSGKVSSGKTKIVKDELTEISGLLIKQKGKLEAVKHDVLQFKQELKSYSKK